MSKRSGLILAIVALVAGAGIATLVARGYYRSYCRELLVAEYGLVTSDGTSFMQLDKYHSGIDRERKARWRWAMGEKLERHLRPPWNSEVGDLSWGQAYAILRDPGWERWSFSPGMDDATRNDLIRYLCWRIEYGRTVYEGNQLLLEFRALGTYPPQALAAHSEMLERVLGRVLYSPLNVIVYTAQEFLISKLGQEWADRTARNYLKQYCDLDPNYARYTSTLAIFLDWTMQRADKGSRPAQDLLGYFAKLSREEPLSSGFNRRLKETAQAALKRIEAAGWAKPKE
jgi:hypothetical protein